MRFIEVRKLTLLKHEFKLRQGEEGVEELFSPQKQFVTNERNFEKLANPGASSLLVSVFFNQIIQFSNKLLWKGLSSIWRWDSNSWPPDYEPPPLTTRQIL